MATSNLFFSLVLLFLLICLLNYTSRLNLLSSRAVKTMDKRNKQIFGKPDDDINPDTMFIYRAYAENSGNLTTIRILAINRCLDPETVVEAHVENHQVQLKARPIEGTCPWLWAPGCLYNSYVFDGTLDGIHSNFGHITLTKARRKVVVPLHKVLKRKKGTLSFCIPPVYWFTDWTKIIFALETWKAQGVDHVFIYYHSSTHQVYKVLRSYQKEGFITIVPWSMLPRSSLVDPNLSLYRLAHSIAHNDCVLRLDSEFGAVIDVDEVITPRSGTLPSLVSNMFSNSSVGALSFAHRSLLLIPPLAGQHFIFEKLNYLGVQNASEFELQGPPKVIFRTEAVDLVATHDVRIYKSTSITVKVRNLERRDDIRALIDMLEKTAYKPLYIVRLDVPSTQAVLLHHRYTHVIDGSPRKVNLLPSDSEVKCLQNALINRTNSIFPRGANFNFNTQKVLGICLKPWRESQHHCKTPLSTCRKLLLPLEDWYFVRSQEIYYTL